MATRKNRNAAVAVLSSRTGRRVLQFVARQPVRSTATIASMLELDRKVVSYYVHLLKRAGLAKWLDVGGVKVLAVTPDAEPLLPALKENIPPPQLSPNHGGHRPLDSHMIQRIRRRHQVPG